MASKWIKLESKICIVMGISISKEFVQNIGLLDHKNWKRTCELRG